MEIEKYEILYIFLSMIQGRHFPLTCSIFLSFIVGILQEVPSLFAFHSPIFAESPIFSKAAMPSVFSTTSYWIFMLKNSPHGQNSLCLVQ